MITLIGDEPEITWALLEDREKIAASLVGSFLFH